MRYASARLLSSFTCAGILLLAPKIPVHSENTEPLARLQSALLPVPIVEQKIGSQTYLVTRLVINCPREKLWALLTDYENAPAVFRSLKKSEVLRTKGNIKFVKQLVCPLNSPFKYDYIVAVLEKEPTSITWHRTGGSMKEVAGSWELQPFDNNRATLTTYKIFLDGGFFLPPWLLRIQLKGNLPKMLMDVKQAAERREP